MDFIIAALVQGFTWAVHAAEVVAAATPEPKTVVQLVQETMRGHGVLAGLGALLVPLLNKRFREWLKQKGIGLFCKWWVGKVKAILAKDFGPIWDPYVDGQIKLHVELAQRVYPGEGSGPQRKAWLLKHFPYLLDYDAEIDQFVKANGQALDQLSRDIEGARKAQG